MRLRSGVLLMLVLLAGCTGAGLEPPSYSEPPTDGMRPGGGLLSGESGEFVIYRR